MIHNDKGFTLIEIITILVIIGILFAIAIPEYLDLINSSKSAAAKSQIAEMQSSANLVYAKLFLKNGRQPTVSDILNELGGNGVQEIGQTPDNWTVRFTTVSTTVMSLLVTARGGDQTYSAMGTWLIPQ
jgi:prepilin-type N-terminal cleavage/methylation domain-containing protein